MCRHCRQLLHNLNFSTIKVCLSEKDALKEFELLEIHKYLEMCLKVDQFFFYVKEKNRINISIDAIDWGDFFHNKETMKIDYIFLVLTINTGDANI